MDSELINQFLRATDDTFRTMLGSGARLNGKPFLQQEASSEQEISAMIGLSGHLQGVIALRFEREVAFRVVQAFLGMEETPPEDQVLDGLGELANIVAGAAKAAVGRPDVSLSLPQVVLSEEGHRLHHSAKMPGIGIPFTSDHGEFVLEFRVIRSSR